jgi:hypothetical protein
MADRFATAHELVEAFATAIGDRPSAQFDNEPDSRDAPTAQAITVGEAPTHPVLESDAPPESLQSLFGPSSSDPPLSSSRIGTRAPIVVHDSSAAKPTPTAPTQSKNPRTHATTTLKSKAWPAPTEAPQPHEQEESETLPFVNPSWQPRSAAGTRARWGWIALVALLIVIVGFLVLKPWVAL